MERIHTKTAEIWMDSEGIIRMEILEDAQVDVNDLKERIQIIKKLSGGKRTLVLSDGRAFYYISKEAREFLAGREVADAHIAMALVANSLPNKLLANFFINFNRPLVRVKVFATEEGGLNWLRSFLKKESRHVTEMASKSKQ